MASSALLTALACKEPRLELNLLKLVRREQSCATLLCHMAWHSGFRSSCSMLGLPSSTACFILVVCVFCAGHWAARGGHSGLPARPVSPGTLELLTSPSPDCQSLSDLLMSSEEEDLLL